MEKLDLSKSTAEHLDVIGGALDGSRKQFLAVVEALIFHPFVDEELRESLLIAMAKELKIPTKNIQYEVNES